LVPGGVRRQLAILVGVACVDGACHVGLVRQSAERITDMEALEGDMVDDGIVRRSFFKRAVAIVAGYLGFSAASREKVNLSGSERGVPVLRAGIKYETVAIVPVEPQDCFIQATAYPNVHAYSKVDGKWRLTTIKEQGWEP